MASAIELSPARATVMPHELAFGALYALVIARLADAPGGPAWSEIAIWCAFATATLALIWWANESQTTLAWRARLGGYLVLMNLAYLRMGPVNVALGGVLHDDALQRVDHVLFGQPLPLYLDHVVTPAATQLLSACYFLLFPYVFVSCVRQVWRFDVAPDETRRFHAGVFTVYGVGLVGYLLVPAAGPYLAMPGGFTHPIAGGWMTALNDRAVRGGSNHVDVFPSLHIAVSTFILFFDRRFTRWRFRAHLVPAVGLWVSTLYLRYHYGIDVLCGFALAAAGLWVAFRPGRSAPNII